MTPSIALPLSLAALCIAIVAALVFFVAFGRENAWALVFGSPDLGPIAFETFKRSKTPNDALIAPVDLGSARADAEPPIFALPADELRHRLLTVADTEPLTVHVASDPDRREDRWVVRTPLMRFPDTVRSRIIPLGSDRSTLALYSKSQIGQTDFGVNRARLARWIEALEKAAPPA